MLFLPMWMQLKNNAYGGEQLPWLKAFYDEIRDDYPVFWVLARGSDDETSVEWDLLQVNGNFVRLMELKDEQENILQPNNEDKYLFATKDRAEELEKLAMSRDGRAEFLSESTKAFDTERNLPQNEVVVPEVIVLEESSEVLSFHHPSITRTAIQQERLISSRLLSMQRLHHLCLNTYASMGLQRNNEQRC